MRPYRLEMGTKLSIGAHKNLYEYWGDTIAEQLVRAMKQVNTDTIVNLASQEYLGAVNTTLSGEEEWVFTREQRPKKV